ncbi:MAG: radical SAM protein [Syntrophomonadaceae bacterium]|nr:radical SAM protein [Syntrophomonadaceae bacterium]
MRRRPHWEPLALFADEDGQVFEHPRMRLLGRAAEAWVEPQAEEMVPLPGGASLVMVPQYYPVGLATDSEQVVCLQTNPLLGHGRVYAVAALLPQGFTRTYLPAMVAPAQQARLPMLGYAAVGLVNDEVWVAATQIDGHRRWHPRFYNTPGLERRICARLSRHPENRILQQLAGCARRYSCFTAQNVFYERWEGGIPTMPACNAACLGCISEGHEGGESPQHRLAFVPSVEEIVEVGLHHLEKARQGIVSFGQGCEGEPALNGERLAEAIARMRGTTAKGTINMNTNAGCQQGVRAVVDAGLDAMRVTIFSCHPEHYRTYHRPSGYDLGDVEESIAYAKARGVFVSINLLVFPGFTDRVEEVALLEEFIRRTGVDMVQLRNLTIDPEVLAQTFPAAGETLGIVGLIGRLRALPRLRVGGYTHPVRAGEEGPDAHWQCIAMRKGQGDYDK